MAIRNIIQIGDDILRKKCREVSNIDERIITLLEDMADTLDSVNGIGLAAPQVGVLKKIVIIKNEDKIMEFINPEIIEQSQSLKRDVEGCLSYMDKYGEVDRPTWVVCKAMNRKGEWFVIRGEDLLARAICHETDHLNGVLFVDKVIRYIEQKY